MDEKVITQEQLKAAYALNMCTVSVSQIVDYNDEYILEQEYEAILNNLNLEQMPKDEALLNILVKLLNVITFFRIDKIKREQIEKKYQQKIKNAIWSAVPNIGVIVAGNPVTVALSLATQVGIGYMNYRREKASALADKEDQEVELRITAMEQFNALRRELFTTAWRLADEYNFPDKFRLTERQISQYNAILMDPDEIRKYERLASVQDKFEAYLPFWYYMGHTAKLIAEDADNGLSEDAREYYRKQAKLHFEKYESLNTFNILREDEITASFALEFVDLLLLEDHPDYGRISNLIETAVSMAGNAKDVLEICAFAYLKTGNTSAAATVLRNLINEDYNTATNAKILTRIYVSEYLQNNDNAVAVQYESLASRLPSSWLFPMPEIKRIASPDEDPELIRRYLIDQKSTLEKEYEDVLDQIIEKYIIRFNRIIPAPGREASDEYFTNTDSAIKRRRQDVYDILESKRGNEYRREIRECGFRFRYVELLNEMLQNLDGLRLFRDNPAKAEIIQQIITRLEESSEDLKDIQDKLNTDSEFSIIEYEKIQTIFSFQRLTEEFFDRLIDYCSRKINEAESLSTLDDYEMDILQFAKTQNIPLSEFGVKKSSDQLIEDGNNYISKDVLAKDERDEHIGREKFEFMLRIVRERRNALIVDNRKIEVLVHGEPEFDTYFKNAKLSGEALKGKTLAILNDDSFANTDLLITGEGVALVKHNKIGGIREFSKIKFQGKNISLGWPDEYGNKAVNIGELYSLLEKLDKVRADTY